MWRATPREPSWTTATVAPEHLAASGGDRLLLFFLLEGRGEASARRRHAEILEVYRRVGPPRASDALCVRGDAPCIFALEDVDGGCVRTRGGRPVVVQQGVCLEGDADAWIRQFCLAQDRLSQIVREDEVPNPVVVIDAGIPSTLWVYPRYLSFLMAQPIHAHVYVVGLSVATWRFATAILYPLPRWMTERVSLHAGYEVLHTFLDPDEGLSRWFDDATGVRPAYLDAYGRRVAIALQSGWRTIMPWWTTTPPRAAPAE